MSVPKFAKFPLDYCERRWVENVWVWGIIKGVIVLMINYEEITNMVMIPIILKILLYLTMGYGAYVCWVAFRVSKKNAWLLICISCLSIFFALAVKTGIKAIFNVHNERNKKTETKYIVRDNGNKIEVQHTNVSVHLPIFQILLVLGLYSLAKDEIKRNLESNKNQPSESINFLPLLPNFRNIKKYNTIKIFLTSIVASLLWYFLLIKLNLGFLNVQFLFYMFIAAVSFIFMVIAMLLSKLILNASKSTLPVHWYIFDIASLFFIISGIIGLCLTMHKGFITFFFGMPMLMVGLGLQYGIIKNRRKGKPCQQI